MDWSQHRYEKMQAHSNCATNSRAYGFPYFLPITGEVPLHHVSMETIHPVYQPYYPMVQPTPVWHRKADDEENNHFVRRVWPVRTLMGRQTMRQAV
jgi:hypothetical protein